MPGMGTELGNGNAVLIAAFRDALLHQGFLIVLVFGVLGLLLVSIREIRRPLPPRVAGGTGTASTGTASTGTASTGTAGRPRRRPSRGPGWACDCGSPPASCPAAPPASPSRAGGPCCASASACCG